MRPLHCQSPVTPAFHFVCRRRFLDPEPLPAETLRSPTAPPGCILHELLHGIFGGAVLLNELVELVWARVRQVLAYLLLAPIAEALEVSLVGAVNLRHDARDGRLLPLAAFSCGVEFLDKLVETNPRHLRLEPVGDQVPAV